MDSPQTLYLGQHMAWNWAFLTATGILIKSPIKSSNSEERSKEEAVQRLCGIVKFGNNFQ